MSWRKDIIALARGAGHLGDKASPPAKPKGKRRGPDPLTDEQVALIKRDLKHLRVLDVAIKYNVSPLRVGRISREECYRDVEAAPDA